MIHFGDQHGGSRAQTDAEHDLFELANQRIRQGLAPPPEIYKIEYRTKFDWSQQPDWAKPVDPQMFDGCCHEG